MGSPARRPRSPNGEEGEVLVVADDDEVKIVEPVQFVPGRSLFADFPSKSSRVYRRISTAVDVEGKSKYRCQVLPPDGSQCGRKWDTLVVPDSSNARRQLTDAHDLTATAGGGETSVAEVKRPESHDRRDRRHAGALAREADGRVQHSPIRIRIQFQCTLFDHNS
jgi:hypothetical protein